MAQPNCPTQKICTVCKRSYKPTSNVQKRCPACKKEHERLYQKAYAATNGGRDGIKTAGPKKVISNNGGEYRPRNDHPYQPTAKLVEADFAGMLGTLMNCGATAMIFGDIKITLEKI